MPKQWAVGDVMDVNKLNNPSGRTAGSASALRAGFGGVIGTALADLASSGAVETDFVNIAVPANTLDQAGQSLVLQATVFAGSGGNAKRLRFYWNSVLTFDTGARPDINGVYMLFEMRAVRLNAALAYLTVFLLPGGLGPSIGFAQTSDPLTAPVTLRLTGQGVANNDLICLYGSRLIWYPVADT